MKQRGRGRPRRSQDMQSVLFNHRSHASIDSVVVPETPTNVTCARPSNAASKIMMSVMETPEDMIAEKGQTQPGLPSNAHKNTSPVVTKPGQGSSSEDEVDSSILDITPNLKLKKKNLMSILESEDSFTRSLKSQRTKNSSMLFGNDIDEEREVEVNIMSPVKRNKRRKSVAQIILPFDLNDTERLSNKLRYIEECEKKTRRKSTVGLPESELNPVKRAKEKRKSVGPILKSFANKNSLPTLNESSDDEVIFNTQKENPKHKVNALVTNRRKSMSFITSTSRNDIRETISNHASDRSRNQNKSENITKIFDSEDLVLTPIKTASQEKSILNIITNLGSQNSQTLNSTDMVEETLPIPATNRLQGMSFQNLSTWSTKLLQIPEIGNEVAKNNAQRAQGSCTLGPPVPETDIRSILKGVVAYVEVRMGSDNRSEVIKEKLQSLGADIRDKFTTDPSLTHVVFKDGSKATFNRALKRGLHLVSSLWVEACRENLQRMPEAQYPSCSIEEYKQPTIGIKKFRKHKSMQPKAFSEEERLANARAMRRMKMAEKSPVPESNEQFFTPNNSRISEECKDSPLFGIGHLLTPKRRSSCSASETEEEEVTERGSPQQFMTPLAKRLYERFISPKTDSTPWRKLPVGSASPLCTNDIKQKLRCTSDESSDGSDGSKERLPKRLNVNKGSSDVMEDGRPQTQLDSIPEGSAAAASNVSKASDSLNLLLSDSSHGQSSGAEDPPKRKGYKRKSSSSDFVSDEDNRKKKLPAAINSVNSFVSEALESVTGDKKNKENICIKKDGDKEPSAVRKTRRQSILKREITTSDSKSQERRKSVSYGNVEVRKVDSGTSHVTPVKSLNPKQLPPLDSPAFATSQPSSSFPASQLRGHKLLNLDMLEPTQDLIIPSTPEDPKKFLRRPYTDMQIKRSKTQRTAMRNQKGGSLSVPLPQTSKKEWTRCPSESQVESSSQVQASGSKAKNSGPVRRSMRLKSAPLSKNKSSDDDVFFSSEDDQNAFKLPRLPKPRRSTEEFQYKGTLIKKGRKGRKVKEENLPSLYLTSVHSKERKSIIPIINKLGGFRVTQEIDSTTTHIVCGEARRTLNLLYGIARGAWILDLSWVFESLDLDKWAPEEPFELFTTFPGAKIARLQKEESGQKYSQTLFSGVGSIHVLEGCTPPSRDLRDLIELTGGKIVSHVRSANLAIGAPTAALGSRSLETKVTHLSEKWVLDSIQHHKIQPFPEYVLSVGSISSASGSSISSQEN